jgi:hypothetical protein
MCAVGFQRGSESKAIGEADQSTSRHSLLVLKRLIRSPEGAGRISNLERLSYTEGDRKAGAGLEVGVVLAEFRSDANVAPRVEYSFDRITPIGALVWGVVDALKGRSWRGEIRAPRVRRAN